MGFLKKHKKGIIILLCVLFVPLIIFQTVYWWVNYQLIIPDRSIASHSKSKLIDLYWDNKVALNEAAESILSSSSFERKIRDGYDGDEYIMFKSDSKYFTKSDWKSIVKVFKIFRPYCITRSFRAGYDVVYISFGEREENGRRKRNGLYYFKVPEAAECYEGYIWVGELEHIDGYWYVDEWVENYELNISF